MDEVRVTRRITTDRPSDISKTLHELATSPHAQILSYDRTNYVVRDCSKKGQRACRVMLNVGLRVEPIKKRK